MVKTTSDTGKGRKIQIKPEPENVFTIGSSILKTKKTNKTTGTKLQDSSMHLDNVLPEYSVYPQDLQYKQDSIHF